MREWMDVAQLTNTKALNGWLVARCASGHPPLLRVGMEVAFVPPVLDAPRRALVAAVDEERAGSFCVSFEGIGFLDVAADLVGCHCLVRRADVPEEMLELATPAWHGWEVCDVSAGPLGVVEGIESMPGQMLLAVARTDAPATRPLLVPLVDEFVVRVDEAACRIVMSVPSGLLEL